MDDYYDIEAMDTSSDPESDPESDPIIIIDSPRQQPKARQRQRIDLVQKLMNMGFKDRDAIKRALKLANEDVYDAVEVLTKERDIMEKYGFKNRNNIHEALKKTNGDVDQAAQLLFLQRETEAEARRQRQRPWYHIFREAEEKRRRGRNQQVDPKIFEQDRRQRKEAEAKRQEYEEEQAKVEAEAKRQYEEAEAKRQYEEAEAKRQQTRQQTRQQQRQQQRHDGDARPDPQQRQQQRQQPEDILKQRWGFYKILKLDRSATKEEIKKAYRKLARKYHPDKNPNDEYAEEMFKNISTAKDVLLDKDKKRKYDIRYSGRYLYGGGKRSKTKRKKNRRVRNIKKKYKTFKKNKGGSRNKTKRRKSKSRRKSRRKSSSIKK
tara:strand:- start:1694 stop:2824 length:1131 start_codon:yes stop_codon:yes gene_type:complete